MSTAPAKTHQREPTTYRCWSNPLVGEERRKPLTYYHVDGAVLLSVQIVEVPTNRYRPDAPVAGIDHVDTVGAAVFALGELGLNQTAKRVAALIDIQRDSPDEPEVNLDSLKRLVRTMQSNPGWGEPLLAVRDDGSVHAEWPCCDDGRVAMAFLPNERVAYSALSAPADADKDVLNVGGYHHEKEALTTIRWFTSRISAR